MDYANQKAEARASTTLKASHKAALEVAKAINRKSFKVARDWLAELVEHGTSLESGKFHDKAAEGLLRLLQGLEKNARQQKLEPEGMRLGISVHKGPSLMRGRRKRNFGLRLKSTHVQAVLLAARPRGRADMKGGVKGDKLAASKQTEQAMATEQAKG